MYILNCGRMKPMARKIEVKNGDLTINENVEVLYERVITPFGNSAKIDAPKKYIGKRAYVIIIKD
jgi:putative transposon-encoded protein